MSSPLFFLSAYAYALFARTKLLNSYLFKLLLYLQTVIIANARRRASHSAIANGLSTPKGSQITNCSHLNHTSPKRNHNSSRTSSSISRSNNYLYLHYFLTTHWPPVFTLRLLIVCRANLVRIPQELTAYFIWCITLSILSVYACSRCACIPVSEFRHLHVARPAIELLNRSLLT